MVAFPLGSKLAPLYNLDWSQQQFATIFVAALMMWVFRLLPDFIPALFVILSTLLLSLTPQNVALSGFTSGSFFLALSVFGLGVLVINSGIFYRFSLLALKHLPKKTIVLQVIAFVIGILLTSFMTGKNSRITLMSYLIQEISQAAGYKKKNSAIESIAACGFFGVSILSVIFMTGKFNNLVLYGMLPTNTKLQFNWLYWLYCASIPALVLILGFLIMRMLLFRSTQNPQTSTEKIAHDLAELGKTTISEWAALLAIMALMVGLMTSSISDLAPAWISLSIFYIVLCMGFVSRDAFKTQINWPLLFYLGFMISITSIMQYLKIDVLLSTHLNWLSVFADKNLLLFFTMVYFAGILGNFILGSGITPPLLFMLLLPIIGQANFSPWVLIFVLLMSTESWLFPYQASFYRNFEDEMKRTNLIRFNKIFIINTTFIFIRLVAILAGILFWHKLGLLV
ncbi:anion permease [uncultured Shewanella sp.]|uniref:SLC13 family permease n=1 Tax=uncultured Shewanella sp. TaxID=173975 RepID=UPI0026205E42|nr:anion permease [uncultured Shewanella sp.]